jgi:NAD(P)-dependent dehydrogenase (short-subunit alcohol dehydrogenase family)
VSQSFASRHVVVTGGGGALGQSVVRALEGRGALCHTPKSQELDLTREEAVVAFYAALPELWASVHLAGGFAMAPLVDTSAEAFRAQHEQNTTTCFLACREAARALRRGGGGGRIVNVAARPALTPTAGMVAYATSKAGVAALTQHLAAELVAEGILVNAVVPSIMDTPANRRAQPDADYARWPSTAEVAEAIVWLASPENTLTSGALVPVYGRV